MQVGYPKGIIIYLLEPIHPVIDCDLMSVYNREIDINHYTTIRSDLLTSRWLMIYDRCDLHNGSIV